MVSYLVQSVLKAIEKDVLKRLSLIEDAPVPYAFKALKKMTPVNSS